MSASFPVRLESYFFITQEVKADPNFDLDAEMIQKLKADAHVRPGAKPHQYFAMVNLGTDKTESKNVPYSFNMDIFGTFRTEESVPESAAMGMIRELGVMLLIGAIRERVHAATATGPWDAYFLDFVPLDEVNFRVFPEKEKSAHEDAKMQS